MVFFVTVVADWLYQYPVHYVVASLAFVCPLVMPRRCITSTVGFFLLGTCLGTFPRMMQEMVSSDSAPAPDMMLVALIAQCILILTEITGTKSQFSLAIHCFLKTRPINV